jgi:hypothetical protein
MLRLIGLLALVAVAAFFTRPEEAALKTAAHAKLETVTSDAAKNADLGGTLGGLVAQVADGKYENFYVASRYSAPATEPTVQCWGVFLQAICSKTASPE